jgi:nucleoside-diphosphate-sugar epimerase
VQDEARVPWIILRPSAVYGPRDRGFLPLFRAAERGLLPLIAPEATEFTLIHVRDVARAVVLAAADARALSQTMFIGHAELQSTGSVLRTLADIFGRPYRPRTIPPWLLDVVARAGDGVWGLGIQPPIDSARMAELRAEGFVCAVDRARELLDFSAVVPFRDGFEETARCYAEGGLIRAGSVRRR